MRIKKKDFKELVKWVRQHQEQQTANPDAAFLDTEIGVLVAAEHLVNKYAKAKRPNDNYRDKAATASLNPET